MDTILGTPSHRNLFFSQIRRPTLAGPATEQSASAAYRHSVDPAVIAPVRTLS
jgi:hypothetical protein